MIDEQTTGLSIDRPDIILSAVLPYPPSTNRLWRSFRGRTVKTQEARDYTETCRLLARTLAKRQTQKSVAILMIVYRPRKRGDLDNREKIVLDALSGAVYDDDNQVVETRKILRDDKENPRLVVVVYELQTPYRQLSVDELERMGFAYCPTCERRLDTQDKFISPEMIKTEFTDARCLDCGRAIENPQGSRKKRGSSQKHKHRE
jgi:crossover junction endodeoxyribonuclease RusA